MGDFKDIRDDQIRIVGASGSMQGRSRRGWIIALAILAVVVVVSAVVVVVTRNGRKALVESEPALFEPTVESEQRAVSKWIGREVDSSHEGFTEIRDTLINDIPIRIFIPHNSEMSLHIGKMA